MAATDNREDINQQTDTNIEDNIDEQVEHAVISLLEDHGFAGKALLDELQRIYKSYDGQHIKEWTVSYENFINLKDMVWYNFEHKPNDSSLGLTTVKYLGSKYPLFAYVFNNEDTVSYIELHKLLEEVEDIIKKWKEDKEIYIAKLYSYDDIELQGETPTELIIHMKEEHPSKYASNAVSHISSIVDSSGKNLKLPRKPYWYCSLSGPINDYEQSSIYMNILNSFKTAIATAIQYHQDLRLVTI